MTFSLNPNSQHGRISRTIAACGVPGLGVAVVSTLMLAGAALAAPAGWLQTQAGDVPMTVSDTWFTIGVETPSSREAAAERIRQHAGLAIHEIVVGRDGDTSFLARVAAPMRSNAEFRATLAALENQPGVRYAQPAVVPPVGTPMGVADEVLVTTTMSLNYNELIEIADIYGAEFSHVIPNTSCLVFRFDTATPEELFDLADAFLSVPGVDTASPALIPVRDRRLNLNDPYLAQQWHLAKIAAQSAWDKTTGNGNVIVAIVDDGYDMTHEDLKSSTNIAPGQYDFTGKDTNPAAGSQDNHGTAVAGLAIGIGGNGKGIAGVCPMCDWLPIRYGASTTDDINMFGYLKGKNVHVASNSWGYYNVPLSVSNAIYDLAINGRGGKGTVVVFAAGNDNINIDTYKDISTSNGAVAVSATTKTDAKASFSNYGNSIDLAAPGEALWTTDKAKGGYVNGKYYSGFGGTSGSAPIVAGAFGLVFSVNPSLTRTQAESIVYANTDKVGTGYGTNGKSIYMGYGRINASKAVTAASGSSGGTTEPPPPTTSYCAGYCGLRSPSGGCYCDSACSQYGDCCPDVCTTCGYCN